jgi:site-specific recombinase XerC
MAIRGSALFSLVCEQELEGIVAERKDAAYGEGWYLVSHTIVCRMVKAQIPNASLHTLRHAHASGLLSRGVSLAAVSARLGHANTNITAAVYAHALPADDQHAADNWDELLTRKPQ